MEKIKKEFPSICYGCANARKPVSESNRDKGWVGCTMRCDLWEWEDILDQITEAEAIGEGWVDLRAPVFGESSGITTNLQLLAKGVKECSRFSIKK